MHGSPGGWDEGELLSRFLVDAGFRVIAPSRPGYLGTPLSDDNADPDAQGRLHLALLDALGIKLRDRVLVGGRPVRLPAGRRRHRSGRPRSFPSPPSVEGASTRPSRATSSSGASATGSSTRCRRQAAKPLIAATLARQDQFDRDDFEAVVDEIWSDDDTRAFVLALAAIIDSRRPGLRNDLEQFPRIDDLGLSSIVAPVLLVHGTDDADVPPAHSDRADAALSHVERHDIDGGSHIALWAGPGQQEAQHRIVEHLRTHAG